VSLCIWGARKSEAESQKVQGALGWAADLAKTKYGRDQRENNYRKAAKLTYRSKKAAAALFIQIFFALAFIFIISEGPARGAGAGGGALAGITCFFSYASKTKASHSQTILSK